MKRILASAAIIALIGVPQAHAGWLDITDVSQENGTIGTNPTTILFSTFHSAERGTSGDTHAQIAIDTTSGFNYWNPLTGQFQLHVDIFDGFNSSGNPTGDFGGKAVGTSSDLLVANFYDSGTPMDIIVGSITWEFSDIVFESDIYEILGGTTTTPPALTTNFHQDWAEVAPSPTATWNTIDDLMLWGNDIVEADDANGTDGTAIAGIDLRLDLVGNLSDGDIPTPEPASMLLLTLGCLALAGVAWRRRQNVGMAA